MSVNKYVNGKLLQVSGNADTRLTIEDIVNILGYTPANQETVAETYTTNEYADETFIQKANVVNDLTSTDTDKPLSANQGQVLQSEISSINSTITNSLVKHYTLSGITVDLSTISNGIYIVTLTNLSVNSSIAAMGVLQKSNGTTVYMEILFKSSSCEDWTITANNAELTLTGTNVYSNTLWSLALINKSVV